MEGKRSALTRGMCFSKMVYKLLRKLFQPTKSVTDRQTDKQKTTLQFVESREHVNLGNQKALRDLSVIVDLVCES